MIFFFSRKFTAKVEGMSLAPERRGEWLKAHGHGTMVIRGNRIVSTKEESADVNFFFCVKHDITVRVMAVGYHV